MGLFAQHDFSKRRGLVFFLIGESRMMATESLRQPLLRQLRCTKVSASGGKVVGVQNYDVVTTSNQHVAGATSGRILCLIFSSSRRSSSLVSVLDAPHMLGGRTGATRNT
ncbi:MAG: hypothetical protein ACLQDM_10145 [Bradyrhizobium sp.]